MERMEDFLISLMWQFMWEMVWLWKPQMKGLVWCIEQYKIRLQLYLSEDQDKEERNMERPKESVTKDMEYLMMLLHKEWERSGKTKAKVMLKNTDVSELENYVAVDIWEKQQKLENVNLTFEQSMELSKNSFVLLRLVQKVKKAGVKSKGKGFKKEFFVALDEEEYHRFMEIMGK